MRVIQGLPVFGGIARAKAFVIPFTDFRDSGPITTANAPITAPDIAAGWERFLSAVDRAREAIKAGLEGASGEGRLILQTHLLMLDDPVFTGALRDFFERSGLTIERALERHVAGAVKVLREKAGSGGLGPTPARPGRAGPGAVGSRNNAALAERADDIEDVFGRVMGELRGQGSFDFASVPQGVIVAARSLHPSEAVALFRRNPAGLCLAQGGASGHLAILARAQGLPSVFRVPNAHREIRPGEEVILDAGEGRVYLDPDAKTLKAFEAKQKKQARASVILRQDREKPCVLRDGTPVALLANAGTIGEVREALEEGASGIGLFRTEFLFMEETGPAALNSEEDQYRAYRNVLEIMRGKAVNIRTLDIGGDKLLGKDPAGREGREENPLLGSRSIRLTLARPDIFKTQVRALLRAAFYGDLRILLPLVVSLDEIRAVRGLVREAQKELTRERLPFMQKIPLGIMVETPAAALGADVFARHADFFSIGTNDLTQYALGVDRENLSVSALFDEFHIAVLRLIKQTVDCARAARIPASVCGEMAGTPESAAFLVGLGVTSLSMAPHLIPRVKQGLSRFTMMELAVLAREALEAGGDGKTLSVRQAVTKLFARAAKA